MSRRFWISDLHLGHKKVAEIRFPKLQGDEAIGAHDAEIMKQLMDLKKDDQLWVLGDISSGRPEEEDRALNLLQGLPVQMHLIAGNHDSVSSIHRNGHKKQREWLQVFESVQQFGRIKLGGYHVLMSHYPYARSGDGPGRGEARYKEFRLLDAGTPLIHGHTHHTEAHMDEVRHFERGRGDLTRWKTIKTGNPDLSQFCVSWDAHRRLVTEGDLTKWLARL